MGAQDLDFGGGRQLPIWGFPSFQGAKQGHDRQGWGAIDSRHARITDVPAPLPVGTLIPPVLGNVESGVLFCVASAW